MKPFKEISNTKNLAVCGLLIAANIVSSIFTFYLTPAVKFSLSFLFVSIIAAKFGPLTAGIAGAITDVIQYFIHPIGAYQPLLTLTCILTGIVFGLFLYKDKTSLWRIIVSRLLTSGIISTIIDTYFISILYGKAFKEFLVGRATKNLICFPIEIIIMFLVFKGLEKIVKIKKQ